MKCIAVVMAMIAESEPLIRSLDAREEEIDTRLPARVHVARVGEVDVVVAVTGIDRRFGVDSIGTEAAALTTALVLERFDPELVITAGTAGGWAAQGAAVGHVVLARDRLVHHDRRIPLPGFDAYGVGSYPVVDVIDMADELGFSTAIVSTGNSFGETAEDLEVLAATGATVVEMESAAVAYVCELYDVPIIGVRVIGNLIDGEIAAAEEFVDRLESASAELASAVRRVIDWVIVDAGGTK